jgi:hypothetical protein
MSKTVALALILIIAIPLAICGGCLGYGLLMAPTEIEEPGEPASPVDVP